jgi:hypothetical protein
MPRCPIWSAGTILPSPAVTSRQPGANLSACRGGCSPGLLSRCVILATRSVATGRFGKVIRVSHQILSSVAGVSLRIRSLPAPSRSAATLAQSLARSRSELQARLPESSLPRWRHAVAPVPLAGRRTRYITGLPNDPARYPRFRVNRPNCCINPPNCCQITCFQTFCPSTCSVCAPTARDRPWQPNALKLQKPRYLSRFG